jgi:hypothetical protein
VYLERAIGQVVQDFEIDFRSTDFLISNSISSGTWLRHSRSSSISALCPATHVSAWLTPKASATGRSIPGTLFVSKIATSLGRLFLKSPFGAASHPVFNIASNRIAALIYGRSLIV